MPLSWALQLLQKQKTAIEGTLHAMGREKSIRRSGASSWSALEIVDHIRKVEAAFVAEMAASRNSPIGISPADRGRALLLIGLMLLPVRLKAPNGPTIHPDAELKGEAALANWSRDRATLLKTIAGLRAAKFRGGVVRHPVSGRMGLTAATWFLAAHSIHHRYQLRRVLHRG